MSHKFRALLLIAVTAFLTSPTWATDVLDTSASGWTVTRTTSSAAAGTQDYLTMPYDGTPTTTNAVVTGNGIWTAQNDIRLANAKWISDLASSSTTSNDPFSTRYVFQSSFTLSQTRKLNLAMAGDNIVDNVILSSQAGGAGTVYLNWNNTVVPIGDQGTPNVGRIYGFTQANVQSTSVDSVGPGTIFVTATLYNYGGPPVPGHFQNGSAYGFIMAIDAQAPEPGSLVLLGLPATLLMHRKRSKSSRNPLTGLLK